MVTGSREAAAGRQWRQHAEASAQGESSASVLPCRVCGRVWRKRRRFAFWRNRPTWRRRRALAIGRAHSLYSHPGWLETAHQTYVLQRDQFHDDSESPPRTRLPAAAQWRPRRRRALLLHPDVLDIVEQEFDLPARDSQVQRQSVVQGQRALNTISGILRLA